jgi:hypothetical protein
MSKKYIKLLEELPEVFSTQQFKKVSPALHPWGTYRRMVELGYISKIQNGLYKNLINPNSPVSSILCKPVKSDKVLDDYYLNFYKLLPDEDFTAAWAREVYRNYLESIKGKPVTKFNGAIWKILQKLVDANYIMRIKYATYRKIKIEENEETEESETIFESSRFSKEERKKWAEVLRGNKLESKPLVEKPIEAQTKPDYVVDSVANPHILKIGSLQFNDSVIQIGKFEISGSFLLKLIEDEKVQKTT